MLNPREKTSYQVVAVVGDSKYRDMSAPAPPIGYMPMMQDEQPKPSLSAVVRMDGPQGPLTAAARELAAAIGAGHSRAGNDDDGRSAERIGQCGANDGDAGFVLCRLRAAGNGHWSLWNTGLRHCAADQRDRHPHGAGRTARGSYGHGLQGKCGGCGCRFDAGLIAAVLFASPGQLSVPNFTARSMGARGIGGSAHGDCERRFAFACAARSVD